MKSWAYVLKTEVAGTAEMLLDILEDGLLFCTSVVEVSWKSSDVWEQR